LVGAGRIGLKEGVGFVPVFLDQSVPKDIRAIDHECAFEIRSTPASEAGVFGGKSTALNVVSAIQLAREAGFGQHIVTLGRDNGAKKLGGHIYRRH
jgi:cysteine synthase